MPFRQALKAETNTRGIFLRAPRQTRAYVQEELQGMRPGAQARGQDGLVELTGVAHRSLHGYMPTLGYFNTSGWTYRTQHVCWRPCFSPSEQLATLRSGGCCAPSSVSSPLSSTRSRKCRVCWRAHQLFLSNSTRRTWFRRGTTCSRSPTARAPWQVHTVPSKRSRAKKRLPRWPATTPSGLLHSILSYHPKRLILSYLGGGAATTGQTRDFRAQL